jgi:hypothetical protein
LQWYTFGDDESEWVPENQVMAADLVRRFWDDVGTTREDFKGPLVKSSDEFIGKSLGKSSPHMLIILAS